MGAPSFQETMNQSTAADENEIDGDAMEDVMGGGVNNDDDGSIVETYTSLIQQYLSVMCVDNAIFLAERLVATDKSSDSLYLLALCHHRSGSPQRALTVLENCKDSSPNIQYLTARCCYELEDYGRAEESLLQSCRLEFRKMRSNTISVTEPLSTSSESMEHWIVTTTPCPVPNGAAGLYLLGNICRKSSRKGRAKQYYRMSLKLDPFLWTSYEHLCELGGADDLDPTSVFGVQPTSFEAGASAAQQSAVKPLQDRSVLSPSFTMAETPATGGVRPMQSMGMGTPASAASSMPKASLFSSAGGGRNFNHANSRMSSRFETPGLTPIPANASLLAHSPPDFGGQNQDPRVVRRAQQVAARLYYQPSPETPHTAEIRTSLQYLRGLGRQADTSAAPNASETPVRRGGRAKEGNDNAMASTMSASSFARQPRALFSSSENNINNNTAEPEGMDDSSHDNASPQLEKDINIQQAPQGEKQEGIKDILGLLCLMGSAWRRLCQYRCREALQIFSLLPESHQNTGWVLNQQGRAYFEMNDFQSARRCLELMQTAESHRMRGLDLLSTVYWQLKKEVELAHLAQRVVEFDKMCPEAWCVVGNCFSLQKEHETALSYFKRSLQLDPSFTYTHTLSGYEYMANEDFDKAVACFRNAIRSDERHYNAWYGLGAIYHRQEKYDLAEYHFQRAVSINPQSSVLRCNLGIAQFSNGNAYQALDTLAEAFRLDPRNPQARFQRATIYSAMNRPAEALAELEKVRDAAPREATVHFAIGRMLKRLGRLEEAMKCFLTAMDLDPKDSQLIKSAMDKLGEPNVDEEDYSKF